LVIFLGKVDQVEFFGEVGLFGEGGGLVFEVGGEDIALVNLV